MTLAVIIALAAGLCGGCGDDRAPDAGHRVLVIGFDGMDPDLLRDMMARGQMPHMARLAEQGAFVPLATAMPPQSPVAWSNVIAGADPGVHEIYDFIHRDPSPPGAGGAQLALMPYLSTSRPQASESDLSIPLGSWRIPLSGGSHELLRRGPTFWEALVEAGVDTTIYRMPANFPVEDVDGPGLFHCLSGMGTPDVLGSYGEFVVFTSDPTLPEKGRRVSGGMYKRMHLIEQHAQLTIDGPPNMLRVPDEHGRVSDTAFHFNIVRDPEHDLVKVDIAGRTLLLKRGEWSGWIQIDFETGMPGSTLLGAAGAPTAVPAMLQLYVKQVHPYVELFVTPLNIDPTRGGAPISAPRDWAGKLAERTGAYFTAGIPEHPPEIRQGGLTEDQWLEKSDMILAERVAQYRDALEHFDSGVLFYYFGTTDLLSHIFWRDRDPDHPGRDPAQGDRYADVIEDCYREMDVLVGEGLAALKPGDTIVVMSDHGFNSFRRGFNVNTWLMQEGYLALRDPAMTREADLLADTRWSGTKAYALGINSLYINLRAREKFGTVNRGADYEALKKELTQKLLAVRDDDGQPVIARVYDVASFYPDADPAVAPDLLIGYARNYRGSWATALGGIPPIVLEDNLDRWSGDHCIAAELVPGILLTNRKVTADDPALTDIGPAILGLYGIAPSPGMQGRAILE